MYRPVLVLGLLRSVVRSAAGLSPCNHDVFKCSAKASGMENLMVVPILSDNFASQSPVLV